MAERRYRFVQVDVFTRRAFGGNQLAVFTDARGLSDDEMQLVALEMNYSESTFVLPPEDNSADARMRIFTPGRELQFAGHPTVGTAFVLGSERGKQSLRLELGIGTLGVTVEYGHGQAGAAQMDQPVPTFKAVAADSATLAALVGLTADSISTDAPPELGSSGNEFLYLPLRSLEAVRRARGDAEAIARFFGDSSHPAVFAFSLESEAPESAAHARMFSLAMGSGLVEDPATGSAAGPFGAYLVRHGLRAAGRLVVEQGYELRRPSLLEVDLETDGGTIRSVRVGGGVVRAAEGELFV